MSITFSGGTRRGRQNVQVQEGVNYSRGVPYILVGIHASMSRLHGLRWQSIGTTTRYNWRGNTDILLDKLMDQQQGRVLIDVARSTWFSCGKSLSHVGQITFSLI